MSGDSAPGTAARVLLIQISDIHFFEPTDAVLKRTAEIAAAVQPLLPLATRVVLIVTGDCSVPRTCDPPFPSNLDPPLLSH